MNHDKTADGAASSEESELWVQPEGRDLAALVEQVKGLQQSLLRASDELVGLAAERDTLRADLDRLATTELAVAFARVDQLEDEREGLVHEVHKLLIDHRLAMEDSTRRNRAEIDHIMGSTTWKLGTVVVKPITGLRSVVRRS